ncbi:MAG: hypothetical protein EOP48_09945 [Sphingobacteriales bacterium]|nr:MAG: hypothetical protein EOP48_09945 [Sphingobacteriales bacterium]
MSCTSTFALPNFHFTLRVVIPLPRTSTLPRLTCTLKSSPLFESKVFSAINLSLQENYFPAPHGGSGLSITIPGATVGVIFDM